MAIRNIYSEIAHSKYVNGERDAWRGGVALFTAATLYCGITKFQGVSQSSWQVQLVAISVSVFAKKVITDTFTNKGEKDLTLLNVVVTVLVIGGTSLFCGFEFTLLGWGSERTVGTLFSTVAIASGSFGMNKLLEPSVPPSPYDGLTEVTFSPDEFKDLLFKGELPSIHIKVYGSLEFTKRDSDQMEGGNRPQYEELMILPERLTIYGHLTFRKWTHPTQIPKDLVVKGDVAFLACPRLTEVPTNIRANSMTIYRCYNLRHLSEGFQFDGDFNLFDCNEIVELPEEMDIGGCFNVRLPNLRQFPKKMKVDSLYMKGGECVKEIPGDTKIRLRLVLNNTKIKEIPSHIQELDNLTLENNSDFVKLPDNLKIKYCLTIRNCPNFRQLSRGLRIGMNLNLEGSNIEELPEDLVVGMGIYLENSKLKRLPSWVTKIGPEEDGDMRTINLLGTRLSKEDICFLRSRDWPGINFLLDREVPQVFLSISEKEIYLNKEIKIGLYVLGLDWASYPKKGDVNRAYRKLARIHHPDKGGDEERFKEIGAAHEMLMDSEIREW